MIFGGAFDHGAPLARVLAARLTMCAWLAKSFGGMLDHCACLVRLLLWIGHMLFKVV